MLNVKVPKVCQNEQHYILDVMLGNFLDLEFFVEEHNQTFIQITRPGSDAKLTLNADFFHRAYEGTGFSN